MTQDANGLLIWTQVCMLFAAIATTAFPILYAFAPWWKTWLGRALMLQAIAFALAVDLTFIFSFWYPENGLVNLAINAFVFTFIAVSSSWLTWRMLKLNPYIFRRRKKEGTNA